MLSYGCHKFYRTVSLLAQLSMLFQNSAISWKGYIQEKFRKLIAQHKKTLYSGKTRFLSSTKCDTMQSPTEFNSRKGADFFALWGRYIIVRKLAYLIKLYQDSYRANPEKAMFKMRIKSDKDRAVLKEKLFVDFYETQSYSLFQYFFNDF